MVMFNTQTSDPRLMRKVLQPLDHTTQYLFAYMSVKIAWNKFNKIIKNPT